MSTDQQKNDTPSLQAVREHVWMLLRQTALAPCAERFRPTLDGGKLLRARLVLALGSATRVPDAVLIRAGAAVEMLHAASLLHDDVVDGGTQRRGVPAVWVSEGTRDAVILGDLLMSLAVDCIQAALPDRIPLLVATFREMCEAEAEQEFSLLDADASWGRCVSIARRKTGSLFGFAAACAGSEDARLTAALREAGYAIGTAYQLADDLLDASPDPAAADKTLGTDQLTGKLTAATANPGDAPPVQEAITALLQDAQNQLAPWPLVQQTCSTYADHHLSPLLTRYLTLP